MLGYLLIVIKQCVQELGPRLIYSGLKTFGTPDRKLTNNTLKNSKQYIHRQTWNSTMQLILYYINFPMESTKIIYWFNSKSISTIIGTLKKYCK